MSAEFTITDIAPGELLLERDGNRVRAFVAADEHATWVFIDGRTFRFEKVRKGSKGFEKVRGGSRGLTDLSAPMPATVLRILTAPGKTVRRGETLILLEAMKMELPLRAPQDGTVTEVRCAEGQLVQPGSILVEMT
ncbi:MAG TPA: acetyl-CoA carboxylase biotin carboxyl carrier protein subunit [Vicinamibacterales bacterium]|jgi:3-methylcrotonyl-CoA carboxylase alpha subunit|nr:acetyl-CoA carboxylase biotin carboxyl carrier protein subunit [Vicinamibacterales bacterium]